ncbi:MAG: AgmX/PglI C-terminal domain-containing protein [Polyangiaceae bacterium]|nr:AgmX/PglI C-terminal domain-containing protein [Polyangiaceae bacterium]MCE7891654.1 hypothetical protein [Sorangiineae bacterium PRO1]MCL4750499.1 AgmX/PglI C-terminal domain-containing protein [Myxococcales bacterium]
MRWAWVLAVVSTSSVALGQATPPPAASRFDAALGRARDGRAAFEKHQAPKRVASSKDFVRRKLGPWFSEVRKLHDEASSRYAKALDAASSAAERVTVLSEAGEMSLLLAERTYRAGEGSMPANIAKTAELKAAYLSALEDTTTPMRQAAAETLTRCATLAEAHAVTSAAARRCVSLRDNPSRVDPKLRASPAEVERGVRQVRAKIRRCYEDALKFEPALAGDLKLHVSVGPSGAVSELKLSGSLAGHAVAKCVAGVVEALPLPPPPKGTKVAVSYPLTFDPAR